MNKISWRHKQTAINNSYIYSVLIYSFLVINAFILVWTLLLFLYLRKNKDEIMEQNLFILNLYRFNKAIALADIIDAFFYSKKKIIIVIMTMSK